ncbi:hypothetical protein BJX64DRAFT_276931 [Aspergillus heterothallicus]
MFPKNILLALGLASLALSTPAPSAASNPESLLMELNPPSPKRTGTSTTGIWLDIYTSGSCSSGLESQPKSGWVWDGQCKNFDAYSYGAAVGTNAAGWPASCRFKFWENKDCHGHATVHSVTETLEYVAGPHGTPLATYGCMATANKADGEFYLGNGAASVLMSC